MSKPIRVDWSESAEELYARFRQEPDPRRRQRLQALWLVRGGESVAQAAHVAGVGHRSLERWLSWYRQGGLAAVVRRVPGHGARGQPSWLTPAQQQTLLAETVRGTFHTYGEARDWVEEQFGVTYSYQGMYTVLARLTVRPQVPRPHAAKADPTVQEAWKRGAWPLPSGRRG